MKRFLTVLYALMCTASLSADIKFDKNYSNVAKYDRYGERFYSMPITADVDPERYHELFTQITNRIRRLRCAGNTDKEIEKEIVSYLKALNSPLSLRLLQDITKNGFYVDILLLSSWLPYPVEFEKHLRNVFKDAFGKDNKRQLDAFIDIVDDVLVMIITCWNNGAYGKSLYDQIVSYLKAIGTPPASKVREMWNF